MDATGLSNDRVARMVAYNRGDHVPAIRLFRPLPQAGNPRAQIQIGTMYRKGEEVSPAGRTPRHGNWGWMAPRNWLLVGAEKSGAFGDRE